MTSSIFPPSTRVNGKGRLSPLPSYSSAIHEKHHLTTRSTPIFKIIAVPIPGVRGRHLRLPILMPMSLYYMSVSRFGRRRGSLVFTFAILLAVWIIFSLTKRYGTTEQQWKVPFVGDPPTLVYAREDLQKIWQWEIASGHYPSRRPIPDQIGLTSELVNPAVPPLTKTKGIPSRFRPPPKSTVTSTRGAGSKRIYLDIQSQPPVVSYPPRPVPGSVADMDVIMDHCDFTHNKYVRDCLEVLRLGGGMDNGNRVRRGKMDDWKYIYLEQGPGSNLTGPLPTPKPERAVTATEEDLNIGLTKKRSSDWEKHLKLPETLHYRTSESLPDLCDPDHPRLYHMFWTGPFTDKPYMALMSYLFTQNLGLHLSPDANLPVCKPQFWLWINPGPAASVPNPSAHKDMFDQLKNSPWASPFLHPRFKDVIQFKLWNTTEQLDGVPEIKEEWREYQESLFNSGGHIIKVPAKKESTTTAQTTTEVDEGTVAEETTEAATTAADEDNMLNRMGSKSSSSYDKLSVVLSDMARFVLCHRFGGTYLDADTILLRDWEELWGWKGAFAYRWSRLEKYNTAVLRMNKNSALGTFLFRTALQNAMDFHPMTISRYTKDAYLEGLLLRLPDALFDPAWLNTEYYQRDRPPQPYFQAFDDFFETPTVSSAAPQALGVDGFFKGSYSYHYHNFWWKPFDASRNWPDLGPRFIKSEQMAKEALAKAANTTLVQPPDEEKGDLVSDDKRDLDWATVLKRTFEGYIRGERPNLYGEWIQW